MRGIVLILIATTAGCFAPKYGNGELRCGGGSKQCPDGYHCASDNTCWKNGSDPSGDSADMAMGADTPDMANPPPFSYPPAAVWTSNGGGSSTATSGNQINVSLGASDVAGTATGSNGATITFGFFSDDIY